MHYKSWITISFYLKPFSWCCRTLKSVTLYPVDINHNHFSNKYYPPQKILKYASHIFCVSQQKTTLLGMGTNTKFELFVLDEKNSCFFIIHLKGFTYCFPVNVCMSLHIIKKRKLILIMLQHRPKPKWQLKLDLLTGNLNTERVEFFLLSLSTLIVPFSLYVCIDTKFVPT